MKKKIIINIIDILCMLYVVGYFLWSLIIPVRIGFSCDIINKILFIFIIVYFSKRIMMKHEYPKPIYAHLNHFKFFIMILLILWMLFDKTIEIIVCTEFEFRRDKYVFSDNSNEGFLVYSSIDAIDPVTIVYYYEEISPSLICKREISGYTEKVHNQKNEELNNIIVKNCIKDQKPNIDYNALYEKLRKEDKTFCYKNIDIKDFELEEQDVYIK